MPAIVYRNQLGVRVPGTTTIISANLGWNKQALMWCSRTSGRSTSSNRTSRRERGR